MHPFISNDIDALDEMGSAKTILIFACQFHCGVCHANARVTVKRKKCKACQSRVFMLV